MIALKDNSSVLHLPLVEIRAVLTSPSIIFLFLSLIVLWPFLSPGRILTVDSPLALNHDLSGYIWGLADVPQSVYSATHNSAPIAFVLETLGRILPEWLPEKLWIILLFWLTGVGASRLPYLKGAGRIYAGILYTVNPFTYVRFVTGQWGVLGAYALAPFAISAFIRLLDQPNARNAVKTALYLTLIGFLQVHGVVIVLLAFIVLFVHRAASSRGAIKNTVLFITFSAALYIGMNLFWMVRFLTSGSGVLSNINAGEYAYFSASSPLDVLSMRGFWLSGPYIDISDLFPVWWLLFLPILFLAVMGTIRMRERPAHRWLAFGLVSLGFAAFALAAGPKLPLIDSLLRIIWDEAPLYRIFRDSHKFVALLALVYAYLGAFGVQQIAVRSWKSRLGPVFIAAIMVIPVVYGLPLIGTYGQIGNSEYPDDWYEARAMIENDTEDFSVLVLPWHLYYDFPWVQNNWKRVANPVPNFFSKPTISGDNLEVRANSSNSPNPVSRYVELLIRQRDSIDEFGELIAPLNAKYVVLLKAADFESYQFLSEQNDLTPVFEGDNIEVFQNLAEAGPSYGVDQIAKREAIESHFLNEVEPSSNSDSLQIDGTLPFSRGTASVVRVNPITYWVGQASGNFLVFNRPQNVARTGWEYEGKAPTSLHIDFAPAFEASPEFGTITYTRFYRVFLPAYAASAVFFIFAVAAYYLGRNAPVPTLQVSAQAQDSAPAFSVGSRSIIAPSKRKTGGPAYAISLVVMFIAGFLFMKNRH